MAQLTNNIKKVVIVGHDNYGVRQILTSLIEAHQNIEFGVIITKGLYYRRSVVASIVKMLKEASIIFCFKRFIDIAKYKLKGDTLYSRVKRKGITFYFTKDVNDSSTRDFINKFAPDIILSTFTMHILNKSTIGLSHVATIGCHPSILPNYRGLEVFFWALANGETSSGVSVFYMDEKTDVGRVIAQERFDIDSEETVESIYDKLTRISAKLLVDTLEKFKQGQDIPIIPSSGKGSYFPMPTRGAYKQFKRRGRRWS